MSEVKEYINIAKTVKLGKYVVSTKGKKPKKVSPIKTVECPIPYVNIKAFEKGIIDEFTDGVGCILCNDGDFLMVWDGSRSGFVGKAIKGALGSTLVKLDFPDIDNNYAYYFLQSKFIEINTRAKGVGIPHVDPNLLWNYDLLIPTLPTQQAIVAKIEELFSELDKGIENLRIAQQQLKTYRQSVLKWAFEGKLTEERRRQNNAGSGVRIPSGSGKKKDDTVPGTRLGTIPKGTVPKVGIEPAPLKTHGENDSNSNVPRRGIEPQLPEGWEWVKLASFIHQIDAGKSFRCIERPPLKEEVGIIKVSAVSWGQFDENESKTCYSTDLLNKAYLISKGDFLFSRANTIELIGASVIVGAINKKLMLSDKILRFELSTSINKYYLLYFLRSRIGRKQIESLSTGNQDSMRNIGQGKIKEIEIPFCPYSEQQAIVEEIERRLSVADKMEVSITQSLQQAEALKQSILKMAFAGRLVTEDVIKTRPKVIKPVSKVKEKETHYFYQVQVLGLIIKLCHKKGIKHGEMTIAKYMYLGHKIFGIPTKYRYERNNLGPYPIEMKKAIMNPKFFVKTNKGIELVNEEKNFKYANPHKDQIENAVNELTSIFSKYPEKERAHKTELLATVCKVVEDIQSTELAAVRNSMKDWPINLDNTPFKNKAEKFNEAETKQCLGFIVKKGWDEILIISKEI